MKNPRSATTQTFPIARPAFSPIHLSPLLVVGEFWCDRSLPESPFARQARRRRRAHRIPFSNEHVVQTGAVRRAQALLLRRATHASSPYKLPCVLAVLALPCSPATRHPSRGVTFPFRVSQNFTSHIKKFLRAARAVGLFFFTPFVRSAAAAPVLSSFYSLIIICTSTIANRSECIVCTYF